MTVLVINEALPFAFADSASFQDLKALLRGGRAMKQPDRHKVRFMLDEEETRLRGVMTKYFACIH